MTTALMEKGKTMDKLAFVFLLGAALALCSCILTDK
jgi:hypothetical protein